MYFWRIENLKRDMTARPLTDREQLPYLIAFVVLSAALSSLPVHSNNVWDVSSTAFTIILAFVGTVYLYRQNHGRKGEHFVQRYLAIGFVVGVRLIVAFLLLAIPIYIAFDIAGLLADETTWAEFLLFCFIEVIVYQRIAHHIRDVAAATARPGAGPAVELP